MPAWYKRTVLSSTSAGANGTTSHTCTFTAATTGNLLVAVMNGAVTFTTPTGWNLLVSAVNSSGLYVFTKVSAGGETSFTVTHNGSDYTIQGVIYEFPASASIIGSNSATGLSRTANGPSVSGLTGSYTSFAARSLQTYDYNTFSTTWSNPSTKDYDAPYIATSSQATAGLTIAYSDSMTGGSFNPAAAITSDRANGTTVEAVAFALSVPTGAALTPLAWIF